VDNVIQASTNPKPETPNPKLETPNPNPETPNTSSQKNPAGISRQGFPLFLQDF
jgi:hypothetical protein